MQLSLSKKIIFYIFLIIFLSTLNSKHISEIRFKNVDQITVIGLQENERQDLLKDLQLLNLNNIFFLKKFELTNKLDANKLIENYEIFKKYPNALDIKIERTEFLAKINKNGKIFLIGTNGKLSDVKFLDKELPFIFGKPKIEEFIKFTNVIEQSKFSLNQVKNLYFFPSKRWDLEFKNNIILKLSKDNTQLSLDQAFEIIDDKNFNNIKVVDARIKNQIILND